VHAAIRGIVLNDIKAEVSTYTPEMQYIYQSYEPRVRDSGNSTDEATAGGPTIAAAGKR
jgi:hypothetical protein